MKFWKTINIKVDQKVKKGATEDDVSVLLSLLDLGNFIHLKDVAAVLVMFKTGIRINTLVQLEERHIEYNSKMLNLEGSIMKNHQKIKLPFDDYLKKLLEILIKQILLSEGNMARRIVYCLLLNMAMLYQPHLRIITFRNGSISMQRLWIEEYKSS
jgi:site-specific recombinase XerC